jgi:hypothetical protein
MVALQHLIQPEIVYLKSLQPNQLDNLYRMITTQWAGGNLSDEMATLWFDAIDQARRAPNWKRRDFFRRRKAIKSQDRAASIARRRRRAAFAPISPSVAAQFTTGELAVLSVIADEVRKKSRMNLPVDMIASIAGVCRSMVQKTCKKAEDLGLINVHRERLAYDRNKLNVVRITCKEWLAWIWGRGGSKNVTTTNKQDLSLEVEQPANPCNVLESNPYQPGWKRLISPTSPGPLNTQNRLRA